MRLGLASLAENDGGQDRRGGAEVRLDTSVDGRGDATPIRALSQLPMVLVDFVRNSSVPGLPSPLDQASRSLRRAST